MWLTIFVDRCFVYLVRNSYRNLMLGQLGTFKSTVVWDCVGLCFNLSSARASLRGGCLPEQARSALCPVGPALG